MKLSRQEMVRIVAEIILDRLAASSSERMASSEEPEEVICNPGGREDRCTDPLSPFHVKCDEEAGEKECPVFTCGSEGEHWDFRCDSPQYFSCGNDPDFECPSLHFECAGEFTCNETDEDFSCEAKAFSCSPSKVDGFQCKYDSTEFNCTDGDLYDFFCDPGAGGGGYDCLPQEEFQCSGEHIFLCHTIFTCPSKHICSCEGECTDEHLWEPPPGRDDDGNPGDFDCAAFTCGATKPGHIPEEKFDCEAGSQFKCLDGASGKFDCGENSHIRMRR